MHSLTREEIKIPDVPYKGIIDPVNKVGYIKLNSFTQTAGQEVRNGDEGAEGHRAPRRSCWTCAAMAVACCAKR
jgi:C-terminal processing protease CtpA/Prc